MRKATEAVRRTLRKKTFWSRQRTVTDASASGAAASAGSLPPSLAGWGRFKELNEKEEDGDEVSSKRPGLTSHLERADPRILACRAVCWYNGWCFSALGIWIHCVKWVLRRSGYKSSRSSHAEEYLSDELVLRAIDDTRVVFDKSQMSSIKYPSVPSSPN